MKKKAYKVILFILIMAMALSTVAFAAEARASEYIRSTTTYISASNGVVTVDFRIYATGVMTDIGVKKVEFYTESGSLVKTCSYTSSAYSYMMTSGTYTYYESVTYNGTAGTSYYAVVTFYAGNSTGSDSVTDTTDVVTA